MVLAKLVEDKINFLNNKILKDKHLDLTDLKKYETELLTYLSFYPLKDFCTKVPICEVTDSNGETIEVIQDGIITKYPFIEEGKAPVDPLAIILKGLEVVKYNDVYHLKITCIEG